MEDNDPTSDGEYNLNFDAFQFEEEEFEDVLRNLEEVPRSQSMIDPFQYLPKKFTVFTTKMGAYMLTCLKSGPDCAKPNVILEHDASYLIQGKNESIFAFHRRVLKKWRKLEDNLTIGLHSSGVEHLYKKSSSLAIPYVEEWESIVESFHVQDGKHLGMNKTSGTIKEAGWEFGAIFYGLPEPYLRSYIGKCHCEDNREVKGKTSLASNVTRKRKVYDPHFDECFRVPQTQEESCKNEIAARFKVHLTVVRTYHVKAIPCEGKLTVYRCHRGGDAIRRRKRKVPIGTLDALTTSFDKLRQRANDRHKGCKFCVVLVKPYDVNDDLYEYIRSSHNGHEVGTDGDKLFLPIHETVKEFCCTYLKNSNNIHSAWSATEKEKEALRMKAPTMEQDTFRFFLTPKDVENLSYRMQIDQAECEDDWTNANALCRKYMEKKDAIFFQPYAPKHSNPEKQGFIFVIQTPRMREVALDITPNSGWAIDSTFKTNGFGFLLYAGVCPNKRLMGMPVWIMICSADKDSGHEAIALKKTLQAVFTAMGPIRPNALIIDKSATERNAFMEVIAQDIWCWKNQDLGGIQSKCKLLLCILHLKRALKDGLKGKVAAQKRDELYEDMIGLLESCTLAEFDLNNVLFDAKYGENPGVIAYVKKGWTGEDCVWREMWPRYCRQFPHRYVNTTNLIKRLWQTIKRTLLQASVNRRLSDLLLALIGNPHDGTRIGGTTLENYFAQKQMVSEAGLYSIQAGDAVRTAKLQQANMIVELYNKDPNSCLKVLDIEKGEFLMRSQSNPQDTWYQVNAITENCECGDVGHKCKHLEALRRIIEEQYIGLYQTLLEVVPEQGTGGTNTTSVVFNQVQDTTASFEALELASSRLEEIDMPRRGTNIDILQANISKGRCGGIPRNNKEVLANLPRPTNKTLRQGPLKSKRGRIQLGKEKVKVVTQVCQICGANNSFYKGETSTLCKNCATVVVKGAQDRGTLGLDGSFVNRDVEVYIEDDEKWYGGRITSYDPSLEGEMAQTYCITLNENAREVYGFCFPDEKIRFM